MSIKSVEFEEILSIENTKEKKSSPKKNISREILGDLSVSLRILAGDVSISVNKLYSLSEGDVIKLEQACNKPMKLMYGEMEVAEGILIVMNEQLGFKITSVQCEIE